MQGIFHETIILDRVYPNLMGEVSFREAIMTIDNTVGAIDIKVEGSRVIKIVSQVGIKMGHLAIQIKIGVAQGDVVRPT